MTEFNGSSSIKCWRGLAFRIMENMGQLMYFINYLFSTHQWRNNWILQLL